MTYAARATIDLGALRHNLARFREVAPGTRALAVIKANGYGHDVVRVAKALDDADGFGVACLDEAMLLRQAGVRKPILLLQGFLDKEELAEVGRHGLDIVVHHAAQIDALEKATLRVPVRVWLKVDTGMHRLGLPPEAVAEAWRRLRACPSVAEPLRLMSHFATADDREDSGTSDQLEQFLNATAPFNAERSIANSGGILGWPACHLEWSRPGVGLYGLSPFNDSIGADHGLKPVMTLTSRLVAVNKVKAGEGVGYGRGWVAARDSLIGVAAVGYGDGYPRHAAPGTPVLVNGQRAPLVGRVSMDMICVDLRDCPDAGMGDPVVLWGAGLPVEEIATRADTIGYELLCRVTQRVTLEYQD